MRVEENDAIPDPPVLVLRQGQRHEVGSSGEVELEDGSRMDFSSHVPSTLPAGYHRLRYEDIEKRLVVAPRRCFLKHDWRAWGWSAQLYSVRSRRSWGIGDLTDLESLAGWAAGMGSGLVLLNPLHAALPLLPQNPSPYFPSSRRFRNPLFLSIDAIPGADQPELDTLRTQARKLNEDRRIDRDRIYPLKMAALEALWSRFAGDPDFDAYCRDHGASLRQFAIFTTLTEHHGKAWQQWPAEQRHPGSPALEGFARKHESRVRFHEWIQWQIDRQLSVAGESVALMQDLPVGFDPDGADAWEWQDYLAEGVNIGAPPDPYSADGQDWGLPPFIPHKLREAAYEPFIQTLRATLRHSGGLRIDHVMGLFRLFWVPQGGKPSAGGYVRYPADDLLAILALESQRAKAFVVGEDLGTVEPGVRQKLAAHQVLSYRLAWFEEEKAERFPKLALAAVTTHDLPTIAGVWNGSDSDDPKLKAKLIKMCGVTERAALHDVVVKTYASLAEAPSVLITATLEDALCVEERPNVPGTTTERPNWSLALPAVLEDVEKNATVLEVGTVLNRQLSIA